MLNFETEQKWLRFSGLQPVCMVCWTNPTPSPFFPRDNEQPTRALYFTLSKEVVAHKLQPPLSFMG